MNYSKFQKIISSIVLFGFFFTFIFRFPSVDLFDSVFAENKQFFNIVSIIVDEEIYSDIDDKVKRYATDIQNTLENTKVVILPTPRTASAFDIASLNENLYFEGYNGLKKIDFSSKLIGTVLIGKLPLPIVYDGDKNSKTILPYVDFEDKSYVYNHKTQKYELGKSNLSGFKPEIWHGVISPNSGDKNEDIKQIKDYFDKNHNFYIGEGNFKKTNGILNGKKDDEVPVDYQPYVFYFDQFRESQSLVYNSYKAYEGYLANKEDLVYNRFSKELAENLKNDILGKNNDDMSALVKKVDPNFDTSVFSGSSLSTKGATDIQSRYIIEKSVKKFLEVFNGPSLGKITEDVHNAGRYNGSGSKVNVDMIPTLISVLDSVSDEVVKSVNNDLEGYIDNLVMSGGLSRKIAIPTSIDFSEDCGSTYTNFLYGKQAKDITNASECSIYLGSTTNSGKLVEANRGLNLKLVQNDVGLCTDKISTDGNGVITGGISGYWAGNTPLNIDSSDFSSLKLRNNDLKGSIVPLFDLTGSKEVKDISKNPSPKNCFSNNFILTNKNEYSDDDGCHNVLRAPINGATDKERCNKTNIKANYNFTFESLYKSPGDESCIYLDGISSTGSCLKPLIPGRPAYITQKYNFKTINSYITHKSPTSDELTKQVASLVTPNLPIDKDRYIDFIGANGNYAKINYPYLFRVLPNQGEELSSGSISKAIKNTLDLKSNQINSLISNLNPSSLTGSNLEIYNKLKVSEYPNSNVDLYNYLKSKPLTNYSIGGEDKNLSYYDTLAFSIYWNNLPSVSAKYKFIFENYLSDEFGGNNLNYHLPKNKKQYEISYLGAPGDSSNMYVKLDPEDKGENPYADIISKNSELNTFLASAKIQDSSSSASSDSGNFKCGPPEGVPIWQWMGAISCRLKDMLPPNVGISGGSCGVSLLPDGSYGLSNGYDLLSKDEKDNLLSCSGDINKNGINDCTESKLIDGSLDLTTDSGIYIYNKPGILKAIIKDKDGNVVKIDNNTKINFELSKINIAKDSTKEFDETNVKTIFDKTTKNEQSEIEAKKYLNFTNASITANAGVSTSSFSTKNSDANIYFTAFIEIKDNIGKSKISLNSNEILVKIRGGNLFLESSKLTNDKLENTTTSVLVSNRTNIYLIDSFKKSLNEVKGAISSNSSSKEKLILSLSNLSDKQTNLPVSYPLTIGLFYGNGAKVLEDVIVNSTELNNFIPLFSITKSGNYKIEITDSLGYKTYKNIDILPDAPQKLDVKLGTTITQAGGNITTHLVSILDTFGNIVSGNLYNIDLAINGDGVLFDDIEGKKSSLQTFEGYRTFRLKSTDTEAITTINFKLKDSSGNVLLQKDQQIRTIKDLKLELVQKGQIKAGTGTYDFDLSLTDKNGNILTGFNSRAYLTINKIYGTTNVPYVDIVDGEAKMSFQPTGVAGQNIPIEFQVEGLNGIIKKTINIYPDVPMKIDLNLSKSKIEASNSEVSLLSVELKDRYGNLVFNDNLTTFKLDIEGNYNNIISSNTGSQASKGGKAYFKIFGKQNPGTAYFKITTDPSISNNKVDIFGQAVFDKTELQSISSLIFSSSKLTPLGEKLFYNLGDGQYRSKFEDLTSLENNEDYKNLSEETKIKIKELWIKTSKISINGMSENVGKIETFYFWNKDKIIGKKYNSLYTTLFGASYGDITKQDYLAGSILFDKDSRSLAVTSLLNEPFNYNDIININPNGAINSIYKGSDLSQDIKYNVGFVNNKLNLELFNDATNDYIGKVHYNLDDNLELKSCIGTNVDFSDCTFSQSKSSILMKSLDKDYSSYVVDGKLVLKTSFGKTLLEISDNGEIKKLGNIDFEVNKDNKNKYLVLKIKSGNLDVAILGINLVGSQINITKNESIFNNNVATLKNSVLVYIKSNSYNSRDIYSDDKNYSKSIYYNDPFSSSKKESSDYFSKDNDYAIENFSSQEGIGWNTGNKFLLSFSAGENVGNSTKNYQSFSLINLGDPVISLKPIKKKFPNSTDEKSFDATVGKLISNDKDIFGYRTFDYNKDGKKDILLIKNDGYLKLLENNKNDFIDKGNLAFISDLGDKNLVLTGDFNGDGYSDIFFVNDKQKPGLLINDNKQFKRIDVKNQINTNGKIVQAKVFDMDNDGKDDIVILDDFGGIYIFYWNNTSGTFTKNEVSNSHGLSLNGASRNDNGLVYFDGLYQFPKTGDSTSLIKENESIFASVNGTSGSSTGSKWASYMSGTVANNLPISDSVIERSIFEEVSYNTGSSLVSLNPVYSGIPDYTSVSPETPEVSDSVNQTKTDLESLVNGYSQYITGSVNNNNSTSLTTFIKSEYSSNVGLDVEKKFLYNTGSKLKSGDTVKVEITLTNKLSKTLKNIAYLENVPSIFKINNDSITSSIGNVKVNGVPGYNFLVDGFSLTSNQVAKITYTVKTLPIQYGFLQVGLYEGGEVGDDNFGDIILKQNNQNCAEDSIIYRSLNSRTYKEGTKKLDEDTSKTKLPDSIAKNAIDNDNNGVPDYIDKIKSSTGESQNYSTGALEKINEDTDKDGIPNVEDHSPNFNNENGGLMGALDSINQSVEEISEGIDNTIASLCNGFGNCFSLPMNWAPLAPGGDPTIFGFPVGDGLMVEEGLPIFSAFTYTYYGPYCGPSFWPYSPLGAGCSSPSAGGRLGTWDPTNFFRLFITPTITGAIGMAACFGGPASTTGRSILPGLSPLVPGGNCIYTAMPLPLCSDDGSEGDVSSIGVSQVSWQSSSPNQYNVINGNCSDGKKEQGKLNEDIANEYLKSKRIPGYVPNYKDYSLSQNSIFGLKDKPLISMNGGGGSDMDLSVDIDIKSAFSGNFSDVIKIKNKRTFSFPDFLMSWVERQIEEIANKLTDFPTIFVVIPDFSGIFNGIDGEVDNFLNDAKNIGNKIEEGENLEQQKIQGEIDDLEAKTKGANCTGFSNSIDCKIDDLKKQKLGIEKSISPKAVSSIQNVYDLLSNIPIVNIRTQVVNVNIPWVDLNTIKKTKFDWELTYKQWEKEIGEAEDRWSLGRTCNDPDPKKKAQCEAENEAGKKILADARGMLSTLRKNIDTLESYKNFPQNINKMLTFKETRLGQIVCNIETISTVTGGRIGDNGKRFKSWVELYVLIKAILESWQILIDIFNEYQAECIACKNERYTLLYFILKLISMIIPEIPVIQFPKWPDIIIDLHNIRFGLEVYIPDFSFSKRPIILPGLPNLYLPNVPNLGIKLPQLPLLPVLLVPNMPDLPSLPSIKLPDLPPPPKLPKILGAFSAVLNILKLVVKMMCILRSLPFAPEWRVGDQIAFITSRTGFMPLDFIDLSLPQFSVPFVDAIEIGSFVNLDFGTDFITEMVRNSVAPLGTFTNDISSMTNIGHSDLDFRDYSPGSVNVDVNQDGTVDPTIGMNGKEFMKVLVVGLSKEFTKMVSYIEENKDIKVDNKDFISIVNLALSSKEVVSNPKTQKLRNLWSEVGNLTYSKEDKKIAELQKNNSEKFRVLKDILNQEIEDTKDMKKSLEKNIIKDEGIFKNISTESEIKSKIDVYNEKLRPYNYNFVKSAVNLKNPGNKNKEREELKAKGNEVIKQVNSGIESFTNKLSNNEIVNDKLLSLNTNNSSSKLLSATTTSATLTPTSTTNPDYGYNYKGLYIVEDSKSYRLFDYTSELTGDEETTLIDYDLDTDQDLLYMVNNELFIKQNLKINSTNTNYVTDSPLVLPSNKNKFFDESNSYIEAVNYFKQGQVSNGSINLSFESSSDETVNNYRIESYKTIDKSDNYGNSNYEPKNIKKSIIDGFNSIKDITISTQNEQYKIRNNLGYISDIGATTGLKLTTKSLIDIKTDISNNVIVNLLAGSALYAGGENFKINYYESGDETNLKTITVQKYQNIEFNKDIKIVGISGDAFIEGTGDVILNDLFIRTYYKKPIFPGTKLEFLESEQSVKLNEKSHIDLTYYDSSTLGLDFREFSDYTLYDLGDRGDDYSLTLPKENGFNYSKIMSFKNDKYSTKSNQELISPQLEADKNPPELTIISPIRVPVYQKKMVNLTPYIYEDSGLNSIITAYVDLDLSIDSDNDLDPKNDIDSTGAILKRSEKAIQIEFGEFSKLENKKIGITLIDMNGNVGFKEVPFEVYSPIPEIETYMDQKVKGNIGEELNKEPIDLYRYRGGTLKKLNENNSITISGNYKFDTSKTSSGLILSKSGTTVATIDEYTGRIKLENESKTKIKVNYTGKYPELIVNYNTEDIYSQFIKFIKDLPIEIVSSFDSMTQEGIYIKNNYNSKYNSYIIPKGVVYNPGTFVIYRKGDTSYTPLISIFPDGRINLVGDLYYFDYENFGNYIVLNLKEKSSKKSIAEILFNVNGSYIMK